MCQVYPHVFSRTVAAVDTKRGYVGMCNGRSAQQESAWSGVVQEQHVYGGGLKFYTATREYGRDCYGVLWHFWLYVKTKISIFNSQFHFYQHQSEEHVES